MNGIPLRLAVPACAALVTAAYLAVSSSLSLFLLYGLPLVFGVAGAGVLARRQPLAQPVDHAVAALRLYYGAHLIWSSLRYWLTDLQPSIPHPVAGPFIDSLAAMGIFPMIKSLEGIIGIMLIANRYVPLVLVLEVPTTMTIFYMNTFITQTPHTLITGPAELAANGLLLLSYFHYYRPFLVAKAEPAPWLLVKERRPAAPAMARPGLP